MEAVCKADFDKRIKAHKNAVKTLEQAKKEGKPTSGIVVPEVGYHDIYGVWFFGRLKEIIRLIGNEQFNVVLGKMMHAYVDVEPKKVDDGIHNITVYGYPCNLYKWTAQGYHRGLVVLADDEIGIKNAEVYRLSGTWSWVLI